MTALQEPQPTVAGEASRVGGSVDAFSMLVGVLAALLLAAFSFAPLGVGYLALAVGLVIGLVYPLAGFVSIALAITTLPLVRVGYSLADIRADELMMVVVLGGTALRMLIKRDLPRNELALPTFVFVAVAGVSMALRITVTHYEIPMLSVLFPLAKHLLRLFLFMAVMWLGSRVNRGLNTIRVALVAGGVLGGIFGIAQSLYAPVETFLTSFYPSIRGTDVKLFWGQRAFAAFDGNPNHLAVSLLLLAFVALGAADAASDARGRRLWTLAAMPMLFGIVASASRGTGLLALVVFSVMWLRRKRHVYLHALAGMTAYAVIVPNLLRTRILQLLIFRDGRFDPESDIFKKFMAWTNPFGSRETLKMTDNFYLDTIVNFWPVALLAFFWLMWVIFKRLRSERRADLPEPGVVRAAFMSFICIAILSMNGSFFSVPRASEILWLVLGLAWAWFELRNKTVGAQGMVPAPTDRRPE